MARPLVVAAAMLVGLLLPLAQVAAKLERSVCYYENWAQVGCFGAPGRAQALQALPSDAAATAGVPRLKRFFKRSPAPSGQHRQALPPELSAGRSPLERRSASTAPPAPPLPPPALITAPPACLPRLLQYRSGSVGGTTCTYLPKNINASLCTHINYAFAFLTDGKPSSACAAPLLSWTPCQGCALWREPHTCALPCRAEPRLPRTPLPCRLCPQAGGME